MDILMKYFIVDTTMTGKADDPAKIFAKKFAAEVHASGFKIFYGKGRSVVAFVDDKENIMDVNIDLKDETTAVAKGADDAITEKALTDSGFSKSILEKV